MAVEAIVDDCEAAAKTPSPVRSAGSARRRPGDREDGRDQMMNPSIAAPG
jgi:hypothetical protein